MNTVLKGASAPGGLAVRAMTRDDLGMVVGLEAEAYPHPWSRANFIDSLLAGYDARIFEDEHGVIGYSILMWVLDEVHLLNLCIAASRQRQGLGRTVLRWLARDAHARGANGMMLEVRPSNAVALALYRSEAFDEIGLRRGYYPGGAFREDAMVLFRRLSDE